MSNILDPRPFSVEYVENPSQEELRALTLEHTPAVLTSGVGSLDKLTRNKARQAKFTYIVTESPRGDWSHKTMSPAEAAPLIDAQRAYIEEKGKLIALDAYVGQGERAYGTTWLYTVEGANIAGMQQVLAFPRADVEPEAQLKQPFQPSFRIIYTPDLMLPKMPGHQAILVDLENWTTYIIGADYFGESKKAALRMLNHYVYQQGGLVLHAGAKAVTQRDGSRVTMTVMGLSGTGKTTTTFSKQGERTEPIQDDMVVLWKKGALSITENGCFAKIDGLSAKSEPVIYAGTTSPEAWLENAFVERNGSFDFDKGVLTPDDAARLRAVLVATGADERAIDQYIRGQVMAQDVVDEYGVPKDGWDFTVWTQNGRSIIPMSSIPGAADLHDIPAVHSMGILNRDEGRDAATPGIVRFTSPAQAAGYFMLGETSKTSAVGKERGKTRSPFTQPFFPARHGLQAARFRELAATMEGVTMWMMNTGFVGGEKADVAAGNALKVQIVHSSAMLEALLDGKVVWKKDPDFGYEIVDVDAPENAALVEKVPVGILEPMRFYAQAGRHGEYEAWVVAMKAQRRTFLEDYGVEDAIVAAVCG